MKRWIWFILAVLIGMAGGLYYGWNINPVKYVETTPATLRIDYQTDYILMVAEAYQTEGDLDLAARRLAVLGETPPAEIVRQAMIYAAQVMWADSDQDLLGKLASDFQTWNDVQGPTSGTGAELLLGDPQPPGNGAFYRVKASQ